ncbi:hypothetical protein Syncc8109_0170 [Synechococcus sp. WH 8109]|nr:hypothetical protein Syncc8109_0170 [Synechococcus sp. WH 8109]
MEVLITSTSLNQVASTHICSQAVNAQYALFGTVRLPPQS